MLKCTEPAAPVTRRSNWMLFVRYQDPIKKRINTERKEESIAGSLNRINLTIKLLKKKGYAVEKKIKN
jgi:hypothetical protein